MWRIIGLIIIYISTLLLPSCGGAKLSVAEEQFARGEYFEAGKTYRKIYNSLTKKTDRPLRGEVAFKTGLSYSRINMHARAAAAFQNAARYGYPDSTLYLLLGKSLQAQGNYRQAADAYRTYLESCPNDPRGETGLRGSLSAQAAKEGKASRYIVRPERSLNSRRSDFSPAFAAKEFDRIYFTTSSEKATGSGNSGVTGTKRSDIFMSRLDEQGRWLQPQPIEGEVNTENDEGVICFSPDGQTMYLTTAYMRKDGDSRVEIYTSKRSDASWSTPQKLELGLDSTISIGHPAIDPSGNWLYFTSDMPGGYGGLDIWRIALSDRKTLPINMGPQINTPGDEVFPYVRSDSLFYFASDGHPGFGGLDIFKATLSFTGDFWSVENMGIPVNSQADDFGITFTEGENGYFSSSRGDARGYDNIYSFSLPDLSITIEGSITDKDEDPVPDAVIRIVGSDGTIQRERAKSDGTFKFKLDRGVSYVMQAGAKGYLNQKQEFSTSDEEEDAEYEVNFSLVALDKPQVVENIFYDFDKATLRPESKEALDELAEMMQSHPNVTIEMGSHTDRKGSDDYNIRLSDRRAKSVVDYLIASGIKSDRLTWKGYGESVPKTITPRLHRQYPQFEEGVTLTEDFIETLDPENQEAADQINRRTEFKVTSIEYDLY